ncbi:MAG TPA: hypothetical protein VHX38_34965, partial [Pseudonocardiaceae bacterium]|nr:hypothetical protein [Pseudonocardiaceae bacterium]
TIESTTTDRATNPPNDHPTTPNHHPKTPTQPNPTQQQDPLKLRGIALGSHHPGLGQALRKGRNYGQLWIIFAAVDKSAG